MVAIIFSPTVFDQFKSTINIVSNRSNKNFVEICDCRKRQIYEIYIKNF